MIPNLDDATDILAVLRYNLGLFRKEPMFGKFNYAEKMEYWAFLWGTMVTAFSSFILGSTILYCAISPSGFGRTRTGPRRRFASAGEPLTERGIQVW